MKRVRALVVTAALGAAFATTVQAACMWPAWSAFKASYLQADGRVIDRSQPEHPTVSEAQAYAAFLALVADDREAYTHIVRWTRDNLAGGDFASRLPAWRWGQRPSGDWGVLDANAASDADLWLAYDLLEGAARWQHPLLAREAGELIRQILDHEVADAGGAAPVLLPGPHGFESHDGTLRVNPSYGAPFVLRRLALVDPRFTALSASQERLLDATVRQGFVPDWAEARSGEGYQPLDGRDVDGRGSYAAIRVYLWNALDAPSAAREQSLARLRPFLQTIGTSALPEWFDPRSGEFGGRGGRAHQAALLPLLRLFDPHRGAVVAARLRKPPVIAADGSRYYSDVLTLIALGADARRYAIAPDGRLLPGRRQCRS